MDTYELSKKYMSLYDELIIGFDKLKMNDVVSDLNDAISNSDMEKTSELYSKVIDWNSKVEQLEGARNVLNMQFHHLRLPSPSAYGIILDAEEKVWKFNA